jgi:hypothetical protein
MPIHLFILLEISEPNRDQWNSLWEINSEDRCQILCDWSRIWRRIWRISHKTCSYLRQVWRNMWQSQGVGGTLRKSIRIFPLETGRAWHYSFRDKKYTCLKEMSNSMQRQRTRNQQGQILHWGEFAYWCSVVPKNQQDGGVSEHIGRGEVH